ncbi:MAG: hypothetical protein ABSF82_06750 [Candidatus Bathyarchaeia archaeon]|jgi:hypothetical protein
MNVHRAVGPEGIGVGWQDIGFTKSELNQMASFFGRNSSFLVGRTLDAALSRMGKELAGKKPLVLITNSLRTYHNACMKELWQKQKPIPQHIQDIRFDKQVHNNKMESMKGEIRDREKVM